MFLAATLNISAGELEDALQKALTPSRQDYGTIKKLIEQGADVNAPMGDGYPLSYTSDLEISQLLIDSGARVNSLVMRNAAFYRTYDKFMLLVKNGGDPKYINPESQRTLLHLAANNPRGGQKIAEYLIGLGLNVNEPDIDGYTPIMLSRNIEMVEFLISKGAKTNVKNKWGETALMWATYNGYIDVVEYWQNKGMSINATDNNGRNVLVFAVLRANNMTMLEYLLEKKKFRGINAKSNNGQTPLYVASDKGHFKEYGEYLIAVGADINNQDNFKRKTVLHLEAEKGNLDNVKFLVEKSAKLDVKDKLGKTPLELAHAAGHTEVVDYLIEKGAKVPSDLRKQLQKK